MNQSSISCSNNSVPRIKSIDRQGKISKALRQVTLARLRRQVFSLGQCQGKSVRAKWLLSNNLRFAKES
jgi:hypothetical protein